MAEIVGSLVTLPDLRDCLQYQKKRLDHLADMWESVWNMEENMIDNGILRLDNIQLVMDDNLNQIHELLGANSSTPVSGVGFELNLLVGQYACPLEAGKMFTNWNIGTTTLTIEGEGGRITDIGTDTSSRFQATAKIIVSEAEDVANNGIHTLTTVSGLVLTASGSTFTANTNDTSMIVTLIETV